MRQFGLATCGTFQTQPRGREGRGGEEERREKGEFLNPRKKKKKNLTCNQARRTTGRVSMPGKLQERKRRKLRQKGEDGEMESGTKNHQEMESVEKKEKNSKKERGEDGSAHKNDSARRGDSDGACGFSGE